MTSATLLLLGALLLGPPGGERQTPVLTPTQPQRGEPAIAPAVIDSERAGPEPEPMLAQPDELPPEPMLEPDPEPEPDALPSWEEGPSPADPNESTPLADWQTPVDPNAVRPQINEGPAKGWGLIGAAGGIYGGMVVTQLITGFRCEADVYCGTRGWPWRLLGLTTMGFAGGGGWIQGKRVAWNREQEGKPVKNPVGRRAAGWTMFVLGLAGFVTDAALYHRCYDGQQGPYFELAGFRYTCSPNIPVTTHNLSTLVGASGLGVAMSAESQLRAQRKVELSVSPWGGRGQAGFSVAGRF
jgi:hypothetical protein